MTEPITTELRGVMSHTMMAGTPMVELGEYEFASRCDAIDAIHTNLERENESLRRELDRVLGEGVPATDENMAENGWVHLPKDADGEYIHVGDVMEMDDEPFEVRRIELDESGEWTMRDRMGVGHLYAHLYRHYHAPTVEDVLREFGRGWHEQMNAPETFDIADYVERYAAKLRLAGDAE